MNNYAHPEVLISTDAVEELIKSDSLIKNNVRLVESNEDQLLYRSGHIPGAVEIDWVDDLNDRLKRDYLSAEAFGELLSTLGANPETTFIFYGDKNNWWACYALWVFSLFGHKNLKIMNGGRLKWEKEGRMLTKDLPSFERSKYVAKERDDVTLRALRDDVLEHYRLERKFVDVRSPEEFRGERLHMPEYPNEGALRGGHIPGALSIPWGKAVNASTHEFLSVEELKALYETENSLAKEDDIIVYCRIGERSSLSWFVLHYLLGYPNVRNYDGSWTEYGNLVNVPIER